MTAFDIAIIVILAASVAAGVYRGLIKEVLSLTALVAALVVAIKFSELPEVWLPDLELGNYVLLGADLQIGLMFSLLFVAVLLVGRIVKNAVSGAVRRSFMSWFDRVLGAVFGFARGWVVVLALVLLAGLTQIPFADGWRASALIPPFEWSARYAMCYVPQTYRSPHYVCATASSSAPLSTPLEPLEP